MSRTAPSTLAFCARFFVFFAAVIVAPHPTTRKRPMRRNRALLLPLCFLAFSWSGEQTCQAGMVVTQGPGTSYAYAYANDVITGVGIVSDFDEANPAGLSGSVSASAGGSTASVKWSVSNQGINAKAIADAGAYSAVASVTVPYTITATGTTRQMGYVGGNYTAGGVQSILSIGAVSGSGNAYAKQEYKVNLVWTDGDSFPGEDEDDELDGEEVQGNDDNRVIGGVDIANDVTGSYLTGLPVVDSYGKSDFVYLTIADQTYPVSEATPLVFASEIAFTMFQVPASGGTGSYELEFAGHSQTLASGATIDFTALEVNGVSNFTLWPSLPGGPLPTVGGFQFFENGPTEVL